MKRTVCVAVLLMIMCSLASACTVGNVSIVFEKEAKEEVLFSLGSSHKRCTREEMIVYFLLSKADYEDVFGEEVWSMKIDGITMENFVKNNILTQALEEKSMSALAGLKGLALTEDDEKAIESNAVALYDKFFGDSTALAGVAYEDILSVLTDKRLAELAFDYITKSAADTEISDAEAKVITVKYLKYNLQNNDYEDVLGFMETVYEQLAGSKFDSVAARYADKTVSGEMDVSRGRFKDVLANDRESLEDKLFRLSDGELSDIITIDGDAVYIFESVEDYDPDKTADNKALILEKRKSDIMMKEYNDFIGSIEYTFNEEMWEALELKEWT